MMCYPLTTTPPTFHLPNNTACDKMQNYIIKWFSPLLLHSLAFISFKLSHYTYIAQQFPNSTPTYPNSLPIPSYYTYISQQFPNSISLHLHIPTVSQFHLITPTYPNGFPSHYTYISQQFPNSISLHLHIPTVSQSHVITPTYPNSFPIPCHYTYISQQFPNSMSLHLHIPTISQFLKAKNAISGFINLSMEYVPWDKTSATQRQSVQGTNATLGGYVLF